MLKTLKSLLWIIVALLTAVIMCPGALVEEVLERLAGKSKLYHIYEKCMNGLYISVLMQLVYMHPDVELKDKMTTVVDGLVREWHEHFDD